LHRSAICVLSDTAMYFHIISLMAGFSEKVTEWKMCFDFFCKFYPKNFSRQEAFIKILSQKYTGLYVKYPLLLSHFRMKLESSRQTYEKCSNIKFHENPSGGNRVFSHAEKHTDRLTDGWTDRHMTGLIVTFFAILRTRLKRMHARIPGSTWHHALTSRISILEEAMRVMRGLCVQFLLEHALWC